MHAYNALDQPMTLHHHGMFFNSTSWMDGALGVSQWYAPSLSISLFDGSLIVYRSGVPPGQSFDYAVPIDTSGQWGTYWIHSHAFVSLAPSLVIS